MREIRELQEHKMFSNKENCSFINNNYRLFSYKFCFIEIKEKELRWAIALWKLSSTDE